MSSESHEARKRRSMKIHFLLIYSLRGLRSLPKYFQNVAAFIINSGSNFHIHVFKVQRNLSFPIHVFSVL